MKKLKTLLILGLFAFFVTPIKAQGNWPVDPPGDLPYNGPVLTFDGNHYWKTVNNTDCDLHFSNWFNVEEETLGPPSTFVNTPQVINYPVGKNSNSGYITTIALFNIWYPTPSPGVNYSIVGVGGYVSVDGGTNFIALPRATNPGTIYTTQPSPCNCFRYTYSNPDANHSILTIDPCL